MPSAIQLRISVLKVQPLIWRELRVPSDLTFHELHAAIQLALGLDGYHQYQFSFSSKRHVVHPALLDSATDSGAMTDAHLVRVVDLLQDPGTRLLYQFDAETPWEIELEVTGVVHDFSGKLPVCVAGARAGLLDDCGGPEGFMYLLKVLSDRTHPDYNAQRRWLGGDYDPEAFSPQSVTQALEMTRILARRVDDEFDQDFRAGVEREHVEPELMELIDRFALVVRPGEGYRRWLEGGFSDAQEADLFSGPHDRGWVFLLPEFANTAEALDFVRGDYEEVMFAIYAAAFGPESGWPGPMSWEGFNQYFDLSIESQVYAWPDRKA